MPSSLTLSVVPGPRLLWPGGEAACVLGRGGVTGHKREGDGATPAGRWPLRRVLYRPDRLARPGSGLPVAALDPADGWCDDLAHRDYNRPVRLPFPAGHEVLWRSDGLYDLIGVLGYNDDPVVPGAGSAIFLHVADPEGRPTAGCVAVSRDVLLAIFAAAGPGTVLAVSPDAG